MSVLLSLEAKIYCPKFLLNPLYIDYCTDVDYNDNIIIPPYFEICSKREINSLRQCRTNWFEDKYILGDNDSDKRRIFMQFQ